MVNVMDNLRLFDAFPKTLEDFRIKTFSGATVTMASCLLAAILFLSELSVYLTPQVTEELLVDVSRDRDRLQINFDITFPHVACPFLTIDAIDVSGGQDINIERNVFKTRLDLTGKPIGSAERSEPTIESTSVAASTSTLDPNRCESCFGAETPKRKCCNSCQDVIEAYTDKGWALQDYDSIDQCKREGHKRPPIAITKEGCRTFGHIQVTRVGGNLHFSPGRALTRNHHHMHDLSSYEAQQINSSHSIQKLSFGESDPFIPGYKNPLDNVTVTAEHMSMSFTYYIKIVPTLMDLADGTSVYSSQYSVTRNVRRTDDVMSESSLPGVFFIYDFAPMMVKYTERSRSFLHFLTSVLAIIGGVFTLAGIVDSGVYVSLNVLRKRQLGKQT